MCGRRVVWPAVLPKLCLAALAAEAALRTPVGPFPLSLSAPHAPQPPPHPGVPPPRLPGRALAAMADFDATPVLALLAVPAYILAGTLGLTATKVLFQAGGGERRGGWGFGAGGTALDAACDAPPTLR